MIRALLLGSLVLVLAPAALGQRSPGTPRPPDEQVLDTQISEMLAGWQIGDVGLLRRHVADDVMVVSGAYEPPLIGWNQYVAAYEAQRKRLQSVRLERRNTFIKVKGDFAWAAYQWEFSATLEGQPTAAQGHSTLLFEKRGGRWAIVHNHTSAVALAGVPLPQPPPPTEKPTP